MLNNLQKPDVYKNKEKLSELKSYESLIKLDPAFINNGDLTSSFKNFICDPTIRYERELDEQILNLKGKFTLIHH